MKGIPIAGLAALAKGDVANFLVAATPGGIEAQEAAGQVALCAASVLPKDMRDDTRSALEKLGVVFGSDADDLFVNVTLPAGWSKAATDHSMWSDLLDEKGRKRGAIFYKAAFYDRSAHMSLTQRFTVDQYAKGDGEKGLKVVIRDGGEIIKEFGEYTRGIHEEYQRADEMARAAKIWLCQNYKGWESPLAYWD